MKSKLSRFSVMQVSLNTNLSEWSEEWIKKILDNDQGEELFFDFKDGINSQDPKNNYNIRKAVSSLANTLGGFIIFGIKDKAGVSGWARLSGIADTTNFSKELTNKISGGKVIPHIFFDGPKIIPIQYNNDSYNVLVIKISSSELKPHAIVSDSDGLLQFWMRGNSSAIAATYPYLTKMIEESSELRNLLAALYLDAEYIDSFADKMVIPEADRGESIPVVKINALVNSAQSSQIISKIPTDIVLINLIWQLREKIDIINSFRDMMIERRALPLTNAVQENKKDNNAIASLVPSTKNVTSKIRKHLLGKYAGVREWINVAQSQNT